MIIVSVRAFEQHFFKRLVSYILCFVMFICAFISAPVTAATERVLQISSIVSNYCFFGQEAEVTIGKTYVFTYKYAPGLSNEIHIFKNRREDAVDFEKIQIPERNNFYYRAVRFTADSSKIWVGFRIIDDIPYYMYCGDFCLYDTEQPKTNLLKDANFNENGYTLSEKWTNPYGLSANSGYAYGGFSIEDISKAGGSEIFKKNPEDLKYALRLDKALSYQWFGQQVALEKGKTYVFTYKFSKGSNAYPCVYRNMKETPVFTDKYEDEFTRTTVVSFSPPADSLENATGQKLIWVGIRTGEPRGADEYLFDFRLYSTDEPNLNLFEDSDFIAGSDFFDGNIWKTAWNLPVDSGFTKVKLENAGGTGIFEKKKMTGNILCLSPYLYYEFFGQQVELEIGKTYVFSYYHSKGDNSYPNIFKDLSEGSVKADVKSEGLNYFKKTVIFTPPPDALDGKNGKKLIWVGIRSGEKRKADEYCGGFSLYDTEAPGKNLFIDCGMTDIGNKWCNAYGGKTAAGFTVTDAQTVSAPQMFRKSISNKYIIKMSDTASYQWFGQQVALEYGKTYKFSYLYSPEDTGIPVIYKNLHEEAIKPSEITEDENFFMKTVTFTPSADALTDSSGKKLIWVGIRGGEKSLSPVYYGNFRLYNANEPQKNLFRDGDWLENYDVINKDCWRSAWGDEISDCFTKVTAEQDGKGDIFSRTVKVNVHFNVMANNKIYTNTLYAGEHTKPPELPLSDYYVVAGWYKDSEFAEKWNFKRDTPAADITLYAKWVERGDTDLDGKLNILDMIRLKKHLAGIRKLNGENLIAAKVTGNGEISAVDLVILRKRLLGAEKGNEIKVLSGGADRSAEELAERISTAQNALSCKGRIYYVSNSGSDSNSGTSALTPFATLEKAVNTAGSGNTVLLERGSVFRVPNGVVLQNDAAYGAYGEGKKPEIWGSPRNYADGSLWKKSRGENIWEMNFIRSDAGIIIFDGGKIAGDMKYYLHDLKSNGDYIFDSSAHKLYIYNDSGNPGEIYSDIEIGSRTILFCVRNGGYSVNIDNLAFKYSGTFAVRGSEGCEKISITNCDISYIGGSLFEDESNRYGNGIEFTYGCRDITVESCRISQIYDAGFTFQISGDEAEKFHTFKNITVKNNLFEYCSWAFEWWIASEKHIVENIEINGNIMRFSGFGIAGDKRHPSHIRGPWVTQNFRITDFKIIGNTFDLTNGSFYAWTLPYDVQPGHTVRGNYYYQGRVFSSKKVPYTAFGTENAFKYADSLQELRTAVESIDAEPAEILWLEN